MTSTEYRVVYRRDGREQYREGFPRPDINWGGYFHNIKAFEVVRWERRTVGDWVRDTP